jgi:uncharacterized protein involved in exopolysaccharide biosynthesis
MTEEPAILASQDDEDEEISAFAIATVLLRWRRMIAVMATIGCGLGLAGGLTSPRVYKSTATFIPQAAQGSSSGLAQAASQLGFSIPSSGGAWSPQMYVELVRSRSVLMPIVLDTVTVTEEGGKRAALVDLLKVKAPTPERRATGAVQVLGKMVQATEERKLGGVTLSVVSRWPSVSLAVAERLVQRVDRFNIETRKSQALAERQFVEGQVAESEAALREVENRLQSFLQGNREIGGSPSLSFERDRLQREVTRLNLLYTSWLQSREEARIREIRDTPVITVLEEPRLPLIGEPRKSVQKGMVGGFAGLALGALIAFLIEGLAIARKASSDEAREFFRLLNEATPQFLKRRRT